MIHRTILFFALSFLSTAVVAQQSGSAYGSNTSQMGSEVLRLEESLRTMQGENERLMYQIEQLKESQKRFQEDMEFRLNNPQGAITAVPSADPLNTSSTAQPLSEPNQPYDGTSSLPEPTITVESPADLQADIYSPSEYSSPESGYEGSPNTPSLTLSSGDSAGPRDLYNEAFRLLNQNNYAGAEASFRQFTSLYNTDPLIGNAWYWLGETFYVRRDFVKSADSFRQGYKALPEGPKAGDNLLKLAMSLSALDKDGEACVVLRQVKKNFSSNSQALKAKTEQEIDRLGC